MSWSTRKTDTPMSFPHQNSVPYFFYNTALIPSCTCTQILLKALFFANIFVSVHYIMPGMIRPDGIFVDVTLCDIVKVSCYNQQGEMKKCL